MAPYSFGATPYTLNLPTIDINAVGSTILTVWVLANQNSVLVVAFLLFMAVWAVDILIKFVTRRKNAPIELGQGED
jgi:hypothetical protein